MPERNAENNRVSVIGVVVRVLSLAMRSLGSFLHNGAVSNRLSDQSDTIL